MEKAINQLTNAIIESNNSTDWASVISACCSVISLIAILILLIERSEKTRPYLQATFELVRSNLLFVTIKNVGSVPAVLKGITFNDEFVQQMDEKSKEKLKNNESMNLTIFPSQRWIIPLNIPSSEIYTKVHHVLNIELKYSKSQKKKAKYLEKNEINFDDYKNFLVYISEMDELTREIKALNSILKKQTNAYDSSINVNRYETVDGTQEFVLT